MAANLKHRNGRHARYNLRGQSAPTPTLYQRTAAQIESDRVASRIKKKWPITRISKRTRGLERNGMSCFLLSGIQGLLHLPKFLNWILSHNTTVTNRDGTTIRFPCRPLGELGKVLAEKSRYEGASPVRLKQCPACVIKRFVEMYWGQTGLLPDETRASSLPAVKPEQLPEPFPHDSRIMQHLRNLDQSLQVVTSGTADYEQQQDPSEFQVRILQACCASTDDELWTSQFKALFQTELAMKWICAKCNTVTAPPTANDPLSFGIAALPILHPDDGPDSIDEAIRRLYSEELFDGTFDCATCGNRQGRIERKRLNVAPELLRIGIAVQMISEEWTVIDGYTVVDRTSVINPNPVAIPFHLDLTEYQDVESPKAPLHYQLESVLSHVGTVDEGHWVATVSGETGIFTADDDDVVLRTRTLLGRQVRDKTFLKSNPQVISDLPMKAVVLTYSRIQSRAI